MVILDDWFGCATVCGAVQAEAKQLAHTRDLERRRAEEAYNARVDKKECPRCHVPQSYAEVHSKTKKCERCNLFYRPKKSWVSLLFVFAVL